MSIQWFPGHMAKTKRTLKRYVDFSHLFLMAVDARAPKATFDPKLIPKNKEARIIFTKEDLADPKKTDAWKIWFHRQGYTLQSAKSKTFAVHSEKLPARVYSMVMGLPNVGKSTLINQWVGQKKAKTGAIPGVTRGPQWVKIDERFYLLDTPGIFFKERITEAEGWKLAAVGVVPEKIYKDQIIDIITSLIEYVRSEYKLFRETDNILEHLERVALQRGLLFKGGRPNIEEAAVRLLADFQRGAWGRLTLETP